MLISCAECQRQMSDQLDQCPHCGFRVPQAAPTADTALLNRPIRIPWRIALPVLAGGLLLFSSMYHIVWIHSVPTPIRRTSLSLSEPMSNLDEISGTPWITAVSRYPLTVKALQQAGVLESDAAREARIQQEVQAKIEAGRRAFEEKLDTRTKELMHKWGY